MRLFTGLSLSPEAATQVNGLIHQLRPLAHLAWTKEEKLHVTTKFIGEWPVNRLDELKTALASITVPAVEVHIRGLHWMPHNLYAAVDPVEPLRALASATDAALEPLGIPRESRAYRPHVTLARIRKNAREPLGNLRSAVEQADFHAAPFVASSFILYLSDSGTYTKLEEYPLTA